MFLLAPGVWRDYSRAWNFLLGRIVVELLDRGLLDGNQPLDLLLHDLFFRKIVILRNLLALNLLLHLFDHLLVHQHTHPGSCLAEAFESDSLHGLDDPALPLLKLHQLLLLCVVALFMVENCVDREEGLLS